MATHVMTTDGISRGNRGRREAPGFLTWLEETASKIMASLVWYRRYRETANELNKLSEKELDDIGIVRGDIPMIALRSANAAQH